MIVAATAGLLGGAPPEPPRVGQVAPRVIAISNGGDWDVERHYRGRYVLLTFWSLDDAASRRQFEQLRQIRRENTKENRLLILSVCTDEMEGDWDKWMRFLAAQGKVEYGDIDRRGPFHFYEDHKWLNAMLDDSNFSSTDAYGVSRPPEAFLIGPDKRLRAVRIPGDQLRDVVAKALKESH